MPVYLHIANLIIEKKKISQQYFGGIIKFSKNYSNYKIIQEDNELISFGLMDIMDFDLEKLLSNGFHFDITRNYSKDFVIYNRYQGFSWKVNWINDNSIFAWHTKCDRVLIDKANEISLMSMESIAKLIENGLNPLTTIK